MGQLLQHSPDSFWVISGSFIFQNYVRILKWLLFLVSITANSKREIFKGCLTRRCFPKRAWYKFWFLSSVTNPREHRLKEGFITPAKRHSVSVSWHLETSLRTINQKNLLNIASSNGEGVFSWPSMLSTVSGEVRGVCVHVVLENTLGWVFYSEYPSFPTGIKSKWWFGNFLKTTFKVWSPKLDHFCVLVESLGLLLSPLCYHTLDMKLSWEETEDPVSFQDFFSPG